MKREHGGKRESHPAGLIDFSTNVNCFGPPEVSRRVLAEATAEDISSYPDPDYPALKEALAGYAGRSPSEIFVSNGSVEIFYWACYIVRPRRVLVISPSFCEYIIAAKSSGAETKEHFLKSGDGFALNLADARRLARDADLVFMANPNNPSGNLHSRDELLELASSLGPSAVLLVDEAFMDFCKKKAEHSLTPYIDEKIWVARSLTKFFSLAGLRIGYLLAPAEVVKELEGKTPPWRVNRLAEMAALSALSDRKFIKETPERTARERERFARLLDNIGYLKPYPSAANFILAEIEHGVLDAPRLQELLIPRGFLIRDTSSFPGLSDRFIRLCVRQGDENEALIKELGDLA
jgi:threonine-phosphate decarboxylase